MDFPSVYSWKSLEACLRFSNLVCRSKTVSGILLWINQNFLNIVLFYSRCQWLGEGKGREDEAVGAASVCFTY